MNRNELALLSTDLKALLRLLCWCVNLLQVLSMQFVHWAHCCCSSGSFLPQAHPCSWWIVGQQLPLESKLGVQEWCWQVSCC